LTPKIFRSYGIIQLTNAEEQVMKCLWKLEKGFLKDIHNEFPEPRPATTTIGTVIKVLIIKGYIGFKRYGRQRQYFPLLQKSEYLTSQTRRLIREYFDSSARQFVIFVLTGKAFCGGEGKEPKTE